MDVNCKICTGVAKPTTAIPEFIPVVPLALAPTSPIVLKPLSTPVIPALKSVEHDPDFEDFESDFLKKDENIASTMLLPPNIDTSTKLFTPVSSSLSTSDINKFPRNSSWNCYQPISSTQNENNELDVTIFSIDTSFIEPKSPTKTKTPSWSGILITNVKTTANHLSVSTELVPSTDNNVSNEQRFTDICSQLPKELNCTRKEKNGTNHWMYLTNCHRINAQGLVFVRFKANEGSMSKIVNKACVQQVSDKFLFVQMLNDLSPEHNSPEIVTFDVEIPMALKEKYGKFFLFRLSEKKGLKTNCPSLESKYSILLKRTEDQIIGVFVDKQLTNELSADFSKTKNPKLSPQINPVSSPDQLEHSKPISLKRKSIDTIPENEQLAAKKVRSEISIEPIRPTTTNPVVRNLDPRINKNRDPRLASSVQIEPDTKVPENQSVNIETNNPKVLTNEPIATTTPPPEAQKLSEKVPENIIHPDKINAITEKLTHLLTHFNFTKPDELDNQLDSIIQSSNIPEETHAEVKEKLKKFCSSDSTNKE